MAKRAAKKKKTNGLKVTVPLSTLRKIYQAGREKRPMKITLRKRRV